MELKVREASIAAARQKTGIEVITIEPGQTLKIETSPNGSEILNVTCPEGKSWKVQIQVAINETDVE